MRVFRFSSTRQTRVPVLGRGTRPKCCSRIRLDLRHIARMFAPARYHLYRSARHKHGDQMPEPGFFQLAPSLGHDTRDRETFWIGKLEKDYRAWSVGREVDT